MKTIQNIYLIGTSHVAEQSVKQIKKYFEVVQPDIVALELDKSRLYGLQHNIKRAKNIDLIKQLGLPGFMFYVFGEFAQKKIGKILKITPGSDMLTAFNIANKNKTKIALIDRDIQITLKRFSKHFKFKELLKLFFSLFKKTPKVQKIDLKKVPTEELIEFAISELKQNFPSIYKILVYERDIYMAKRLSALSFLYPDKKILAVVGAGHVSGMIRYLEKILNSKQVD